MKPAAECSLEEHLRRFRSENGLAADEAVRRSWVCRVGPWRLVLPNFAWRRNAIAAHDLHHVLTGYSCTLRGECEMAAWEFGAGPMPHWAATLFCLPLILVGLASAPRRLFAAFRAGCGSASLHGRPVSSIGLAEPFPAASARFVVRGSGEPRLVGPRFALLVLRSAAMVLTPVALALAAWIALCG